MAKPEQFGMLRTLLRALGLSAEAIDDIVARIADWLGGPDAPSAEATFPYRMRDDFLSPAELSFYRVLAIAVADTAVICPKVALGDLFFARSADPSSYRTATNRIDRKHVDFLLCDPQTMRPWAGVELDDKSHQRADRQARDAFVAQVFAAAQLPLVRVPVRHTYAVAELRAMVQPHLTRSTPDAPPALMSVPPPAPTTTAPTCPKCGSVMVLRTAKSGANQGGQFWGCTQYPTCRGIVPLQVSNTE